MFVVVSFWSRSQILVIFIQSSSFGQVNNPLNDPYFAISNLKNYIICAYPNYFILGKTVKTTTGIKFGCCESIKDFLPLGFGVRF